MVSQAFSSVENKHYPAVVLAMFPYFANYIMTRFNGKAGDVVSSLSSGIVPLGQGAMFTGLLWGAILVFIIDNEFHKAAYTAGVAALLSATGFMHAPKLGLMNNYEYVVGYLVMGLLFMIFKLMPTTVVDEEEAEKALKEHKPVVVK